MNILTLNAGSSSLKFGMYAVRGGEPKPLLRGEVSRLDGTPETSLADASGKPLEGFAVAPKTPYDGVLRAVLEWCRAHAGSDGIAAAGHRVVHGGSTFVAPVLATENVLPMLEALASLAPLHNPHNVAAIRMLREAEPQLPNVACFDTAFHAGQAPVVRRYGLPRALEAEGIVRYGFHGLSYEYIARKLRELDPVSAHGKTIVAHLGNGASLCAIRDGASIATTMGFSVLDGLIMGTRCGTLDPGVLLYLLREKGYDAQRLEHMLYEECGLRGLSGGLSDMRELRASTSEGAREAIETFAYRIVREIGSLCTALGGLDAVVFTGGIGEHDARTRAEVCAQLGWLGVVLDPAANARVGADPMRIGEGRVVVWTIPADEDLTIARGTLSVLEESSARPV